MSFVLGLLSALMASLLTGVVIIATRRLHGHLTFDSSKGVQKLHQTPTPRVGGIALAVGAAVGGLALPVGARDLWWLICLAAVPAFATGLLEDVTKRVGVRARLMATILAGAIFCLLTGYRVESTDIPGLDWALGFWLPAVLFTAVAIGGVANALNIVDGVNGLASGTAIIVLSGMAAIAWNHGDTQLMLVCLVAIGALAGFFLLNFPMGLLFLGDAGAYSAGFVLAVVAVLLPARNPELTPLVSLLALSYPVIETMVSIHRRMVRQGSHPGQPDRLHLHSLVYRSMARRMARALGTPRLRNPLTAVVVWAFPLLAVALAVLGSDNRAVTLLGLAIMALVYAQLYRRVALLRGPVQRLQPPVRKITSALQAQRPARR